MSLFEHLAELRMRIIRSGLAVLIGAVIVVAFYDTVLGWLIKPYLDLCRRREPGYCGDSYDPAADQVDLFILDPVEGLTTRLRVAFYGGIILALPVLLWQLWKFVVPALHKSERRYAVGFVASSVLLFLTGGAIAFSTLGRALEFLIDWAGSDVDQVFQVTAYIRLVTLMVVAFGVGFTIPVMLVFLQLLGVLTPQVLLGAWRYAIVGTFLVAAAITPSGDPISLLALSVPMVVLYFVAILIGRIVQRRRARNEAT
ncbi:MAG: twin-arginine translocase subunit TatC [Ilumatobacteraceae bacterium]|nr:twin-arginine translocase subunit TatC [Ilumatobacteraceae bacterium]